MARGAIVVSKSAAERARRAKGALAVTTAAISEVASAQVGRDPTDAELLRAVATLSLDQLRPYGRLLRKRLAEHAEEEGVPAGEAPDVDVAHLRTLCAACPQLRVEPDGEADWSAVLVDGSAKFVDIYSADDTYSEEFWEEAAAYFESAGQDDMNFPGGRYVCAQGLLTRNLPILAGRSLGQVSHIVQIAMTKRKLLGYLNGAIVPWTRSQTMVKHQCAEQQRLCRKARMPLASWETLRACLRDMLNASRLPNAEGLPLSNVKRVLRARFRIDLSETALGHPTVCDLFRDERLQDLCAVRLLDNGYFVFPGEATADDGQDDNFAECVPRQTLTPGNSKKSMRKETRLQKVQRVGASVLNQTGDAASLREMRDSVALPYHPGYTSHDQDYRHHMQADYHGAVQPMMPQSVPEAGARMAPTLPGQRPSPAASIFSTQPLQEASARLPPQLQPQPYAYNDQSYNYMAYQNYSSAWGLTTEPFELSTGFALNDANSYEAAMLSNHAATHADESEAVAPFKDALANSSCADLRRPSVASTCEGFEMPESGSDLRRRPSLNSASGAGSDAWSEVQASRRQSGASMSGAGSEAASEVSSEVVGDASARVASQSAPCPFKFGVGFHHFLGSTTTRMPRAGAGDRVTDSKLSDSIYPSASTYTSAQTLAAAPSLMVASTPSPFEQSKGAFACLLQAAVAAEEDINETDGAESEKTSGMGSSPDNASECESSEAFPEVASALASPSKMLRPLELYCDDCSSEDEAGSEVDDSSPLKGVKVKNTFIDVRNNSAALRLARSAPPRGRQAKRSN